ncbi:MAG TPA: lipocalin family protein [Prolixibacteraceae bacterium]
MKKSLFIALTLFVFILSSCKKDEAKSRSEMLTGAKWKLSSMKINGVAEPIEDCSKDDFFIFTSGGTCTSNPGANKCYSDEVVETSTWSLSSDEKSITIDGNTATIVELTQSRFTYSEGYDNILVEVTMVAF